MPVKILIAGGFGAGKTTLVNSISEIPPLSSEAAMTTLARGVDNLEAVGTKTTTTVALDFGRITVDKSLRLYLFGTPGQDRFGFMWNQLVTGALGGIVVVDSRRIEDSFPAIDFFESRRLPFVIALNPFSGLLPHTPTEVRYALDLDPDVPVVTSDVRKLEDVKSCLLALLDVVLARALKNTPR
ncbi:MAG: GTP-binding protein [Nocardioides sp.]